MRFLKLKARARLTLFAVAGYLVPGGVPFGLVDHRPLENDHSHPPRQTGT